MWTVYGWNVSTIEPLWIINGCWLGLRCWPYQTERNYHRRRVVSACLGLPLFMAAWVVFFVDMFKEYYSDFSERTLARCLVIIAASCLHFVVYGCTVLLQIMTAVSKDPSKSRAICYMLTPLCCIAAVIHECLLPDMMRVVFNIALGCFSQGFLLGQLSTVVFLQYAVLIPMTLVRVLLRPSLAHVEFTFLSSWVQSIAITIAIVVLTIWNVALRPAKAVLPMDNGHTQQLQKFCKLDNAPCAGSKVCVSEQEVASVAREHFRSTFSSVVSDTPEVTTSPSTPDVEEAYGILPQVVGQQQHLCSSSLVPSVVGQQQHLRSSSLAPSAAEGNWPDSNTTESTTPSTASLAPDRVDAAIERENAHAAVEESGLSMPQNATTNIIGESNADHFAHSFEEDILLANQTLSTLHTGPQEHVPPQSPSNGNGNMPLRRISQFTLQQFQVMMDYELTELDVARARSRRLKKRNIKKQDIINMYLLIRSRDRNSASDLHLVWVNVAQFLDAAPSVKIAFDDRQPAEERQTFDSGQQSVHSRQTFDNDWQSSERQPTFDSDRQIFESRPTLDDDLQTFEWQPTFDNDRHTFEQRPAFENYRQTFQGRPSLGADDKGMETVSETSTGSGSNLFEQLMHYVSRRC